MRKSIFAVLVVTGVAAAALGGVAWGSHDENTIHACGKSGTGLVRIVDSESECKPAEEYLEWSIEGPQGPAGVNTFRSVQQRFRVAATSAARFFVPCQNGEVATGGGYEVLTEAQDTHVGDPRNAVAFASVSGRRFGIGFRNGTAQTLVLIVHAVCVPGTMTFDEIVEDGSATSGSTTNPGYPPQPSPSDDGSGGNTGPK